MRHDSGFWSSFLLWNNLSSSILSLFSFMSPLKTEIVLAVICSLCKVSPLLSERTSLCGWKGRTSQPSYLSSFHLLLSYRSPNETLHQTVSVSISLCPLQQPISLIVVSYNLIHPHHFRASSLPSLNPRSHPALVLLRARGKIEGEKRALHACTLLLGRGFLFCLICPVVCQLCFHRAWTWSSLRHSLVWFFLWVLKLEKMTALQIFVSHCKFTFSAPLTWSCTVMSVITSSVTEVKKNLFQQLFCLLCLLFILFLPSSLSVRYQPTGQPSQLLPQHSCTLLLCSCTQVRHTHTHTHTHTGAQVCLKGHTWKTKSVHLLGRGGWKEINQLKAWS